MSVRLNLVASNVSQIFIKSGEICLKIVLKFSNFNFKLLALVTIPSGRQEGAVARPVLSTVRSGGAPGREGAGTSTTRTGAE